MDLILASSSPRRHHLLKEAGFSFRVITSDVQELHDAEMLPASLCEINAQLKAADVAKNHPTATVIGSDTLVFIDEVPLGKPTDMADAKNMLRRLSGRTHFVCTGVCYISPEKSGVFHEISNVTFRNLSDEAIDTYFSLVNPLDKAGSYGIQEHSDSIIESVTGSFNNVMGFPIETFCELMDGKSIAKWRDLHSILESSILCQKATVTH